jgi:hypothetical protein
MILLAIYFKHAIGVVKKCHPCQIFNKKMYAHSTLLHISVTVAPFSKWRVNFMGCHSTSVEGHKYIIMVVDYLTNWDKAMPTSVNDGKSMHLFIFNHVINSFDVPLYFSTNHGSHFKNKIILELEG